MHRRFSLLYSVFLLCACSSKSFTLENGDQPLNISKIIVIVNHAVMQNGIITARGPELFKDIFSPRRTLIYAKNRIKMSIFYLKIESAKVTVPIKFIPMQHNRRVA